MKKIIRIVSAISIGAINSVIGACGGILAVECLKADGISQKNSHATAISIILPLSLISTAIYYYKGYINIIDSLIFIIPGTFGAVLGAKLLNRINDNILNKVFALFMIYAGVRMFYK